MLLTSFNFLYVVIFTYKFYNALKKFSFISKIELRSIQISIINFLILINFCEQKIEFRRIIIL